MILLMGCIALWLWGHIVIASTSLIGSFVFFMSLSLILGGFPNIYSMANSIKFGEY